HKLARARPGFGIDAAVAELRENIEILIWKNSFVYYDEDAENSEHSARIGISYKDVDGDRAFDVARDLANIVIETGLEQREELAHILQLKLASRRNGLEEELAKLASTRAGKLVALMDAQAAHREGLAQVLALEIVELDNQQKSSEKELSAITTSRDVLADRIAAAGLDMSLEIVDEQHPERPTSHAFLIVMIVVVVGIGALLGS